MAQSFNSDGASCADCGSVTLTCGSTKIRKHLTNPPRAGVFAGRTMSQCCQSMFQCTYHHARSRAVRACGERVTNELICIVTCGVCSDLLLTVFGRKQGNKSEFGALLALMGQYCCCQINSRPGMLRAFSHHTRTPDHENLVVKAAFIVRAAQHLSSHLSPAPHTAA